MAATGDKESVQPFGPVHIIDPKGSHTHTAIILHGRGSTGAEFAEEFLDSTLSDIESLIKKLPGCRWIFPSSRELWSTAFQEDMPAWFEAHSLTDITSRQELQVDGIRESVDYISEIVKEEVTRLGGNSKRLLLGGISQGGAIALWTLLCRRDSTFNPGAVVVASTWLPFATNIERALTSPGALEQHKTKEFDTFVDEMITRKASVERTSSGESLSSLIPVFFGHGIDDAYVDVELGKEAARIISLAGFPIEWKEYSGAEEEGHWFKVPEEMDDILKFLTHFNWVGLSH